MNPRIGRLRPYPFERLRTLLDGVLPPDGLSHIPLSIGEPRHAAPRFIAEALVGALPALGTYPAALGLAEFRTAVSAWLERRFALDHGSVRPEDMVLPVNGTREGLFSFVQAALDDTRARPAVMLPNPFYQIYEGAALLAGAEPVYLNCDTGNGYLPDLDALDASDWDRCQLLFLCSPGNPTGAVMPEDYLRHALVLSERHGFVIASDECYSEIYRAESRPPPGLLQAAQSAGRRDFEGCVVFHSLSKRSSVPGLRSGFVAGDPALLSAFRLYRTYHGCAMPIHAQLASIPAWQDEAHVVQNRELYRRKFDLVVPLLREVLEVEMPEGAFYLWPLVGDDEAFTRGLYSARHVTVVPGSYLARDTATGNPGRGRVRISLVASVEDCVEAARRIVEFVREGC
jgi:N-succinyldiaminopimelate aminotransferase